MSSRRAFKSLSRATPVTPRSPRLIPEDTIRPTAIHFAPSVKVTTFAPIKQHKKSILTSFSYTRRDPLPSPGDSILLSTSSASPVYPVNQWTLTDPTEVTQQATPTGTCQPRTFTWPTVVHCFKPNSNGHHYHTVGSSTYRIDSMTSYKPFEGEDCTYRPELQNDKKRMMEEAEKRKKARAARRKENEALRVRGGRKWAKAIVFVLGYQMIRVKDWARSVS
ncbi:hypothetical protein L486_02611 [Kwoniella mangroviensis CBS 10435]|uniref:Uncharacterized protein n=1 Tax=Kwoniella mangroviensis CBS 10435 TaxID=1331196 RepID=A0A1B9IWP2_9TREE|nr:hypothetical protein L486_02611 [Kwoniella mangroviensis CBS 10435]